MKLIVSMATITFSPRKRMLFNSDTCADYGKTLV